MASQSDPSLVNSKPTMLGSRSSRMSSGVDIVKQNGQVKVEASAVDLEPQKSVCGQWEASVT
jgi:hypothetical protein